MEINKNNIKFIVRAFNDLISSQNINLNENNIDEYINDIIYKSKLFIPEGINNNEYEIIKNHLLTQHRVKMDVGIKFATDNHEPWFLERKDNIDFRFWSRYKEYLINEEFFSAAVANSFEANIDVITNLLGDPLNNDFDRRGLIIGDVQSGKTANYIGLMCKAADAGYKVFILLTGVIEDLRRQTQERVDEGFIGKRSGDHNSQFIYSSYIGVGKIDNSVLAVSLTSTQSDFSTSSAQNMGFNFDLMNGPVVLVVKKNTTILKRLYDWLVHQHDADSKKIDFPLLLIDDEADNASINTNKEEVDPTRTNELIRKILALFSKSNYVGYTATPYANVFINPNSEDEMLKGDLFPKDFIYVLDPPSNYIGASDIFNEKGNYFTATREINDVGLSFPFKHKNYHVVKSLPDSLIDAIYTFMVANAIRDLNGDVNTSRSMLVNVSRFINVQVQVKSLIDNTYDEIYKNVKLYSKLPFNEAMQNNVMKKLYEIWEFEYAGEFEYSWDSIRNQLIDSISSIEIDIVNSNTVREKTENSPIKGQYSRKIVVGGLALSRGLTLKGLLITYIYRNSRAYDTLMQMGRWFGYRPNYDRIFRIWISGESAAAYDQIAQANHELKSLIRNMNQLERTPKNYGLKIRSDINSLEVTAMNKRRTSETITRFISLSGEVIETPRIPTVETVNSQNYSAVVNFAEQNKHKLDTKHNFSKDILFKDISKDDIMMLLNQIQVHPSNIIFHKETLIKFLEINNTIELSKWDVAFIYGSGIEVKIADKPLRYNKRIFKLNGDYIQTSKNKNRLGGPTDTRNGLTDEQYIRIISDFKKTNDFKDPSAKTYMQIKDRNPIFMIYIVELDFENSTFDDKDSFEELKNLYKDKPIVGFGVGIPLLASEQTTFAKYVINLVEYKNINVFDDEVDESDEDFY